jgi:hypothetical protein
MLDRDIRRDLIWRVLSREAIHPHGVQYLIDQQTRTTYRDGEVYVGLIRDTISEIYHPDAEFDKLPGTRAQQYAINYTEQGRFNNRDTKCFDESKGFEGNEECIAFLYVDGCVDCIEYIEGLGGGSFYCQGVLGDIVSNTLIYYKTGNEEWGTPFDFTVATDEISDDPDFIIYPNPASRTIHTQLPGTGYYDLVILNTFGQVLVRRSISRTISEIDVSKLSAGMYFIHVTDKNKMVFIKPLVIHH